MDYSHRHYGHAAAAAGYKRPRPLDRHGKMHTFLVFPGNKSEYVVEALERRGCWQDAMSDKKPHENKWAALDHRLLRNSWDFVWKNTVKVKLRAGETTLHNIELPRDGREQLVARVPAPMCIASKTGLLRSLRQWCKTMNLEPHDIIPTAFIVDQTTISEYEHFVARFKEIDAGKYDGERVPRKHVMGNIWIVKPEFLFAGKGIDIADNIGDIEKYLKTVGTAGFSDGSTSVPPGADWVIQKYIERPLLLGGRKFDIRVNVLLTDDMRVYIYQDGFCRTSTETYAMSDITSEVGKMVHITNNCMQIGNARFGQYEEGNILSFEQLQTVLDSQLGSGSIDVRADLMPRWKELILDSICAAREQLSHSKTGRKYFEMFGYDFLVDEDLRTWLLEVNTNPSLEFHNAWAERTLRRMVDDMVSIAVDPHFPPPPEATWKPLPVDVYTAAFESSVSWVPPSMDTCTAAGKSCRDPRRNGWELIFAPNGPLCDHQRAMAENSINKSICDANWAMISAGSPPLSRDEVLRLAKEVGLPEDADAYALQHRYIHTRDDAWHYPLRTPHED